MTAIQARSEFKASLTGAHTARQVEQQPGSNDDHASSRLCQIQTERQTNARLGDDVDAGDTTGVGHAAHLLRLLDDFS